MKDFANPPDELPDSLADDNKAIFQKEYAVQIASGATPDAAEQRAAAKTPFAAARAKKGYTKVKVEPSTEIETLGRFTVWSAVRDCQQEYLRFSTAPQLARAVRLGSGSRSR
jgi:hypothetical protein